MSLDPKIYLYVCAFLSDSDIVVLCHDVNDELIISVRGGYLIWTPQSLTIADQPCTIYHRINAISRSNFIRLIGSLSGDINSSDVINTLTNPDITRYHIPVPAFICTHRDIGTTIGYTNMGCYLVGYIFSTRGQGVWISVRYGTMTIYNEDESEDRLDIIKLGETFSLADVIRRYMSKDRVVKNLLSMNFSHRNWAKMVTDIS